MHIQQLESSYQNLSSYYSDRNTGGDGLDSKQDEKELKNIPGNESDSVQTG